MLLLHRGLAYQARLATPCLLYYSLATMLLLHIGHAALGVSFLTAPLVIPYSLYYSVLTLLLPCNYVATAHLLLVSPSLLYCSLSYSVLTLLLPCNYVATAYQARSSWCRFWGAFRALFLRPCVAGTVYSCLINLKNPTPYILHSTPYTLHSTPYTLHSTPYTLDFRP